jgi:hypothetical protein
MLSQEISRLNGILHQKVNESQEIASRYSRMEYEYQVLRNENTHMISRLEEKELVLK